LVDFSSLSLPGFAAIETDPRKIFQELPAGDARISNLWAGQEAALEQWYSERDKSDILIELNTGAGKSVVGLLVAESSHRRGGRVVYVCPNNDLVEQVGREADKLGLKYSTRSGGKWSNDLYVTGKAFAITNYDGLLTPRSRAFSGDDEPTTIIFDDAHVAESKVREQYTAKVARLVSSAPNQKFNRLAALIIESAPDASWKARFENILVSKISADPRIAPMSFGARFSNQLDEIFLSSQTDQTDENFYIIDNIYGKWDRCAVVFGVDEINIIAPVPPILTNRLFSSRSIKRVYLSATLTQQSDFCRAFGRKPVVRIQPAVDAGDGERLVITSRRAIGDDDTEKAFVTRVTQGRKALFAVPNGAAAKRWASIAVPAPPSSFTAQLNAFRAAPEGRFMIVGRFDGIDLPHDQCRLMVIDGVPSGGSLFERFIFDRLYLRAELAAKIATRVAQLFGRINRGQKDFGIYIVCSVELKNWLQNHRNLALLPELLQKQILLGELIQSDAAFNTIPGLSDAIEKVLARDGGWTGYYSAFLRTQSILKKEAQFAVAREEALAQLILAQADWFRRVWSGDVGADTVELEGAILRMSTYDQKAAGLADLWIGMVKERNGDREEASVHFDSAQSRLLSEIPFERVRASDINLDDVVGFDLFAERQLSVLTGSVNAVYGKLQRTSRATLPLDAWGSHTFRQLEEAVRALGQAIGFDAQRPDSEDKKGPDGIWIDEKEKRILGIELKTDKLDENNLTKDEVGQCHNHEQWIKDHYPSYEYLGLVVITDAAGVTGQASPSPTMYSCSSQALMELRAKLIDAQNAAKPHVARGDLSLLKQAASDRTWSLAAVAARLKEAPLRVVDG
jgi:hypothetical protein